MNKKILIPVIAGLAVVIGVVMFFVLKSKTPSYYNIHVMETIGKVEVDRDGGSVNAYENMKLRDRDYIRVPSDGFARIDCDRSTYSHFEHDTEASFEADSDKKLMIRLVKGEMVVELQKKLLSDESLLVKTPNTTMAIRGTVISIKTEPTADGGVKTINYCLEGKAIVETENGESITLNAGDGWLTVTDEDGNIVESTATGAADFEYDNIDVNSLKGAEDAPMTLNMSGKKAGTAFTGDVSEVEINGENFPDMIFRMYVMDQLDTDKNMVLSGEELMVGSINVDYSGVKDLKGIEYFKSLKLLWCSGNELTTLDLRHNIELDNLFCRENKLTKLDISNCRELTLLSCGENSLSELEVGNCKKLVHLDCSNNMISKLDLTGLTELDVLICNQNAITELKLSDCAKLQNIDCSSNQISDLDVTNNSWLIALYCHNNSISGIDVSNNTKLENFDVGNNMINRIDVSNNPELIELSIYTNKITALDVSHNPKLQSLRCDSNELTSLDVSKTPELKVLSCGFNDITSLDIRNNTKLTNLTCFYTGLTELDVRNNPELTDITYDIGKCTIIK
ncbi:MAG: FecR domain-containing protein [Lachnospiraceae bacterium]|nr:FecR domain-containing protein [Lachnospiraceae bacterium]